MRKNFREPRRNFKISGWTFAKVTNKVLAQWISSYDAEIWRPNK